jgi:hypothetical protein
MKFIKILNLSNGSGQVDYKGLDINQFIPGSQVYPIDASFCLVATNESLSILPDDVQELQQSDYITQGTDIRNQIINNGTDPISQLKAQNAQMLIALVAGGVM